MHTDSAALKTERTHRAPHGHAGPRHAHGHASLTYRKVRASTKSSRSTAPALARPKRLALPARPAGEHLHLPRGMRVAWESDRGVAAGARNCPFDRHGRTGGGVRPPPSSRRRTVGPSRSSWRTGTPSSPSTYCSRSWLSVFGGYILVVKRPAHYVPRHLYQVLLALDDDDAAAAAAAAATKAHTTSPWGWGWGGARRSSPRSNSRSRWRRRPPRFATKVGGGGVVKRNAPSPVVVRRNGPSQATPAVMGSDRHVRSGRRHVAPKRG